MNEVKEGTHGESKVMKKKREALGHRDQLSCCTLHRRPPFQRTSEKR